MFQSLIDLSCDDVTISLESYVISTAVMSFVCPLNSLGLFCSLPSSVFYHNLANPSHDPDRINIDPAWISLT